MTRRALAGTGNQVALLPVLHQLQLFRIFSRIRVPRCAPGFKREAERMNPLQRATSDPSEKDGDYYHNHRAGYPCLRGALCEAPRRKHAVLFPFNTHIFALLSRRNCRSTNTAWSWGVRAAWEGGRSKLLSFLQRCIAFFRLKR